MKTVIIKHNQSYLSAFPFFRKIFRIYQKYFEFKMTRDLAANPIVFQCKSCKTIIGDSHSLVGNYIPMMISVLKSNIK